MEGKTVVGVGVGAFITEKDQVLLMLRSANLPLHRTTVGMWSVPGGKIEFGESAETAVARECLEELGVEVEVKKFIGYSDQILSNAHWISLHFLCSIRSGQPRVMEPNKCDSVRWFDLRQLPPNAGITHVLRPTFLLGHISFEEFERRRLETLES